MNNFKNNAICHKQLLEEYSENYDNVQKMVSNEINNLEFVLPNFSVLGSLSKTHLNTVLKRVKKIRSSPHFLAILFAICIDSFTCMIKNSSFYSSYLYDNKINRNLILELLDITYMTISTSSDIPIENLSSFIAILIRSAKRIQFIDDLFYQQVVAYIMRLEIIRKCLIDNKMKFRKFGHNSISKNQKLLGVSNIVKQTVVTNNLQSMAPIADGASKTVGNSTIQLNSVQPSIVNKNTPVALNNFKGEAPNTNGTSKHSGNHQLNFVQTSVLKKNAPAAGVCNNVGRMAPSIDSTGKNSGNQSKELNSVHVLLQHNKTSDIIDVDAYFNKMTQQDYAEMEKKRKTPFKQRTTNQKKITDYYKNYNDDIPRDQYVGTKRSMEKENEFNRKENIQPPCKMPRLETYNEVQPCSSYGNKKCV